MSKLLVYIAAAFAGVILLVTTLSQVMENPWAVVEGLFMGLAFVIPMGVLYFPYPLVAMKARFSLFICALVFGYFFVIAADPLSYKVAVLTVALIVAGALYVRSSPLHEKLEVAVFLESFTADEKRRRE